MRVRVRAGMQIGARRVVLPRGLRGHGIRWGGPAAETVRALGAAFLVAIAVVTAESTQAVGALLLLGLLAAPAGAAHQLTARPYAGLAIAGMLWCSATENRR